MEIKHVAKATDAECAMLFDIVKSTCLMAYPTKEAQDAALDIAKMKHKEVLDKYINSAFQVGYNVGMAKANAKDDEMYKYEPYT